MSFSNEFPHRSPHVLKSSYFEFLERNVQYYIYSPDSSTVESCFEACLGLAYNGEEHSD